ncbi:MAG: CotH kinase family protein [Solirubrobacteraceae bacterium]
MNDTLDKEQFWDAFKTRAVVVTDLPDGHSRDLANGVNEAEGHGDASLRTRAEYSALFDALSREPGSVAAPGTLRLREAANGLTPAGQVVQDCLAASKGKAEFFDQDMYMIHVTGWPPDSFTPEKAEESSGDARLELWRTDPRDDRRLPPPDQEGVLLSTPTFSLMNSGNRTLRAPKRSWKINFDVRGSKDRFVDMSRLNLKAMFNDPSQLREALAWRLFAAAGVPASQHTYAKLAINERYMGLFFFVEQVDRRFLKDHFGANDRGNLYKAYCGDVGCATLEHRVGADGDDGGRQYFTASADDRSYRLKTNEDDPHANTYDDLAQLVRTIDGAGLSGGDDRFGSDAFHESIQGVMNVRALLRWAGVNLLVGSWDNYFATPANYYLYNAGHKGAKGQFVESPYFVFLPWDYDNSFGIDYFGTRWQYTDIVDWPSNTRSYWAKQGARDKTSHIPLVKNLLRNHDFCQYYVDHLEHLLDTAFSPDAVSGLIGPDGGGGLWERVRHAAYLEADAPYSPPFTGRQFTNDEVYLTGCKQNEIRRGEAKVEGIVQYVRMRCDSAREQLATLRKEYPSGAGGATFPGVMEPLPGHP